MAEKKGFVAVFSPAGKMIAHTSDAKILRRVASQIEHTLPNTPSGDLAAPIIEARREALRRIAQGEGVPE